MISMSPLSEEDHPVLLRIKGDPQSISESLSTSTVSKRHQPVQSMVVTVLYQHVLKTSRIQSNTQKVFMTFILILNMSQDLMTKLVIYSFQRYLNIKLLKIQIQIASYK